MNKTTENIDKPITLTNLDAGRLYIRWIKIGWSLYVLENAILDSYIDNILEFLEDQSQQEFEKNIYVNEGAGGIHQVVNYPISEISLFYALHSYVRAGFKLNESSNLYLSEWWKNLNINFPEFLKNMAINGHDRIQVEYQKSFTEYYEKLLEIHNRIIYVPDYQMKSVRKEAYSDYLQSGNWKVVRLAALHRAGHKCQICNGTEHLEVHHRTYERLGEEAPNDLVVLDRPCHELFHINGKLIK